MVETMDNPQFLFLISMVQNLGLGQGGEKVTSINASLLFAEKNEPLLTHSIQGSPFASMVPLALSFLQIWLVLSMAQYLHMYEAYVRAIIPILQEKKKKQDSEEPGSEATYICLILESQT